MLDAEDFAEDAVVRVEKSGEKMLEADDVVACSRRIARRKVKDLGVCVRI